jgi:hypothetical protein
MRRRRRSRIQLRARRGGPAAPGSAPATRRTASVDPAAPSPPRTCNCCCNTCGPGGPARTARRSARTAGAASASPPGSGATGSTCRWRSVRRRTRYARLMSRRYSLRASSSVPATATAATPSGSTVGDAGAPSGPWLTSGGSWGFWAACQTASAGASASPAASAWSISVRMARRSASIGPTSAAVVVALKAVRPDVPRLVGCR